MDFKDLLMESAERAQERFESALAGLSLEEANTFPVAETFPTIKSLTWLTWHTARELDFQIADLAGLEPVWYQKGWKEKFLLSLPDDTEDWHHSPEEAHQVVVTDLAYLKGYLSDAIKATLAYIRDLDAASLDQVIDENWQPPVKRGNRLVSIIDDAAMHSGQAVYARRLLGKDD